MYFESCFTEGTVDMKQWYELLFENYGKKYDEESFAQGTIGESDDSGNKKELKCSERYYVPVGNYMVA